MKATLLTSALAFCAVTAFAADQQPAPGSTVNSTTLSLPPSNVQQDSPLVAAAKRTGRLGKKPTAVITNETLSKTGGHFTTTASQEPLPNAPSSNTGPSASNAPVTTNNTPTPAAPKKDDKAEKDRAAAAAQTKKANQRAVADYAGDSVEPVTQDPSQQEGIIKATTTPSAAPRPKSAEAPAAPQRPPGR